MVSLLTVAPCRALCCKILKNVTIPCFLLCFEYKLLLVFSGKKCQYVTMRKLALSLILLFFLVALFAQGSDTGSRQNPETVSADEAEQQAKVVSFSLMPRGDAVIISWKTDIPNARLILYRSIKPFRDLSSLATAVPLASFVDNGMPYIDYPIPHIPYYYALVSESDLLSSQFRFIPGENTSSEAIEIFSEDIIKKPAIPPVRPIPLPYLQLPQQEKKEKHFFSSKTEAILRSLTAKKYTYTDLSDLSRYRKVEILQNEVSAPSTGDAQTLRTIVFEELQQAHWDKAITQLQQFLSLQRTKRITARSYFYLGQAYFFTEDFKSALLAFLTAEKFYPKQSKEWIQYTLMQMGN